MDPSKDLEVVLNPEPEVWYRFTKEYRKINWGAYYETYEYCLKNFDPEDFQFYAAFDKETKEIVGSMHVGRYESIEGSIELVCIGKYFVMAQRRGQGVGEFLWKKALGHPNFANKNLGLIGAQAMTKKYCDNCGFDKYYDSDLIVQYRKISDLKIEKLEINEKLKILDYLDVDPMKVVFFDSKVNGNQRRDKFLKDFLKIKSMKSVKVAFDEDDEIVGFIALCEAEDILSLCPLFAVDIKTASTLLRKALESIENLDSYRIFKTVSFEKNQFSNILFNQLTENQETRTKLYGQFTKFVPEVKYDQVYSLTELGTNVI